MMYLVIAAIAALVTLLVKTDAHEWFLLPLLSVAQMDSSTLPRAFEYVTDSGRYLIGQADSRWPTCIPDFSAGFQVMGLFNARIALRNRVAVELAKRVSAGDSHVVAVLKTQPQPGSPTAERPAATERKSASQGTAHETVVQTRARLAQKQTRTTRRIAETSLIEKLKSKRFPLQPTPKGAPPRWSCDRLRSPEEINWRRSNVTARVGPVRSRWPVPWRAPRGRQPFRGGPTAA